MRFILSIFVASALLALSVKAAPLPVSVKKDNLAMDSNGHRLLSRFRWNDCPPQRVSLVSRRPRANREAKVISPTPFLPPL